MAAISKGEQATEVTNVDKRPDAHLSLRLPPELRARIEDYRRDKRMSVNGTIIAALLAFLPPVVPTTARARRKGGGG